MTDELVPLCAPECLDRGPPLRTPADLAGHTLLQVEPRKTDWSKWLDAAGVGEINPGRGQQFPTQALALDAAMSGLGIAIGDRRLVANDVEHGRLVIPFKNSVESDRAYYLVYPQRHEASAKLAAFRDWLLSEV